MSFPILGLILNPIVGCSAQISLIIARERFDLPKASHSESSHFLFSCHLYKNDSIVNFLMGLLPQLHSLSK